MIRFRSRIIFGFEEFVKGWNQGEQAKPKGTEEQRFGKSLPPVGVYITGYIRGCWVGIPGEGVNRIAHGLPVWVVSRGVISILVRLEPVTLVSSLAVVVKMD